MKTSHSTVSLDLFDHSTGLDMDFLLVTSVDPLREMAVTEMSSIIGRRGLLLERVDLERWICFLVTTAYNCQYECQKLIESMPRRIEAVYKAKRGYTKY